MWGKDGIAKNLSLVITVCHLSASLVMPNGDPWDGFFYPILSLMMDSHNQSLTTLSELTLRLSG